MSSIGNMIHAKFPTLLRSQPLLIKETSSTEYELAIPLHLQSDCPVSHCFLIWSSTHNPGLVCKELAGRQQPGDKPAKNHHLVLLVGDMTDDAGMSMRLLHQFSQLQAR